MSTDPIADLLTQIRNAHLKFKPSIEVPYSNVKFAVAELLQKEGYLKSVSATDDVPAKKAIKITLKYHDGQAVIKNIRRISKPGQRIYLNNRSLPRILSGYGIAVVSTSQGLMTAHQAKSQKIGGEIICEVY